MPGYLDTHRALLDKAVAAAGARTYWSAYPEAPSGKIYGETAKADAEAAFKAMFGKSFDVGQSAASRVGAEASPWGIALGITYAAPSVDELVARDHALDQQFGGPGDQLFLLGLGGPRRDADIDVGHGAILDGGAKESPRP